MKDEYLRKIYEMVVSNEISNGSKERDLEEWYLTELMLDEIHSDILKWFEENK